jgi:hypothetical protein
MDAYGSYILNKKEVGTAKGIAKGSTHTHSSSQLSPLYFCRSIGLNITHPHWWKANTKI